MYHKFNDDNKLKQFIYDNYFNASNGKLIGNEIPMTITEDCEDFKYLNKAKTVKLKSGFIDGTMKVEINPTTETSIQVIPISKYCINAKENIYSFY